MAGRVVVTRADRRRLRFEHPGDPMMWVSRETIYQSLYVQVRGMQSVSSSSACAPAPAPAPVGGGTPQPDPRHGHDQPTSARGRRPGRPWGLGGRSPHGSRRPLGAGHTGGADHPLRPAAASGRRHGVEAIRRLPAELAGSVTWGQGCEIYRHRHSPSIPASTIDTGVQSFSVTRSRPGSEGRARTSTACSDSFPRRAPT